jgi:hypothetical protein
LLFALYPSLCVVENIGNEEGRKIRVEGEGGERKNVDRKWMEKGGGVMIYRRIFWKKTKV